MIGHIVKFASHDEPTLTCTPSLWEMLRELRAALTIDSASARNKATQGQIPATKTKLTHIQLLDQVIARHFQSTSSSSLSLSGRHLPLLYKIISSLVAPPYLYTLLVIDIDGRFDACRLSCQEDNLQHIYIQRPARGSTENLRTVVAEAERFMLYGDGARASGARQWWGTVVLGGLGVGDIGTGWKGWLRLDREHIRGFTPGIGAREAMEQRPRRQDAVDATGWAATSEWGGFSFKEANNSIVDSECEGNGDEGNT